MTEETQQNSETSVESNEDEYTNEKTPPQKNDDLDAWFTWYQNEIKNRIQQGQSFEQIKKELNISHVQKFIDGKK
jgi:hypothetical protein